MTLKLITGPASEPLTLPEAKAHLRVTSNAEDALITDQITVVREQCEGVLRRRKLISQSWQLTLDDFDDRITIPMVGVTSITSIKYDDPNGIEQTIASSDYVLKNNSDDDPPKIVESNGYTWPDVHDSIDNVRIVFVCGYANAAAVPAALKKWMLLQIGHWYNNRESVNIGNIVTRLDYVDSLLDPYRVWGF
ncbi:head-tail connector protein [Nitrosomonas communis]|uniref:head-tail connector protein n=1 Tax=Nitrosomonas communis TaxID=44574 RepID=UPI003D2BF537